MSDERGRITVREGMALAAAAGYKLSRPTVLSMFKGSGAATRLGLRFYMPRNIFEEMLRKGVSNEANEE